MAKIEEIKGRIGMRRFFCPACKEFHYIGVAKNNMGFPIWQFNGDNEIPTVSPSVMVEYHGADKNTICHSFISDGKIRFLSDCTHGLAGKTVDMVDLDGIDSEH